MLLYSVNVTTSRRALIRLSPLPFEHYIKKNGSCIGNCFFSCIKTCARVDSEREEKKDETMILNTNLWRLYSSSMNTCYKPGTTVTNSSTPSWASWPPSRNRYCYQQDRYTQHARLFATATKHDNDKQEPDNISKSAKAKKVAKKGFSKMRELFSKYGWTFVGTYAAIYVTTLATLFIAVNWGWMDPPSITFGGVGSENILEGIGVPHEDAARMKEDDSNAITWMLKQMETYEWARPYAEKLAKNPNLINLGIAWVVTKFTEPLRLALAVGVTPRVARALGMASAEEEDDEDIRK